MLEIEQQEYRPVADQGLTCTRSCHEVIGSGKNEAILLAVKELHHCAAMREETEHDYAMGAYNAKRGV